MLVNSNKKSSHYSWINLAILSSVSVMVMYAKLCCYRLFLILLRILKLTTAHHLGPCLVILLQLLLAHPLSENYLISMTNIVSNTRYHYHESALMTAAHILTRLTQEGKSIEQIARSDFDNNMELVTVWI